MKDIKSYVESNPRFDYGEMYREITGLMEDIEYLQLHYSRVCKSKKYEIRVLPYFKPSDRDIFNYLISWYGRDYNKWEEMFYILRGLEYLFDKNYESGWKCNFEIYEKIEKYLEEKDIILSNMVTHYIGCSRGISGFYESLREYKGAV